MADPMSPAAGSAPQPQYDRLRMDGLTRAQRYKLLTGSVIPRPIAFVTTLNEDGGVNAAPFSQFIIIAADPGLLGFSIGPGPGRRAKDTLVNVRRTQEFVINTVPEELAAAVQLCADNEVPGESELAMAGLTTVASEEVAPPRVAETLIQFECRLERIVEFGNAPNSLVVGRIVLMHARHGLVDDCRVDAAACRMLGRIGGRSYCRVNEFIAV
jgi:flavin reductase (DIM6/NTAB) family NADH-FMN oxidoreductase RutF